jgi:hypothetical protein
MIIGSQCRRVEHEAKEGQEPQEGVMRVTLLTRRFTRRPSCDSKTKKNRKYFDGKIIATYFNLEC